MVTVTATATAGVTVYHRHCFCYREHLFFFPQYHQDPLNHATYKYNSSISRPLVTTIIDTSITTTIKDYNLTRSWIV